MLAKETLNKTIPALLSSGSRARLGIASAEVIPDTTPLPHLAQDEALPSHPGIQVVHTDTLSAAARLHSVGEQGQKVAILNMASPLRPGGGFLTGATSQEEFLCMRTTHLPSLREEFYRLPELGAVYTPDVLVFRNSQGGNLDKKEQFYVDVVTAGMLRFPDVEEGKYVNGVDAEMVHSKMRTVMRILVQKGATKVVLGAWGCGAYGNPVAAIAEAWKKVLFGSKKQAKSGKGREVLRGVQEIVFAITDASMADVFKICFEDSLEGETATKKTTTDAAIVKNGDKIHDEIQPAGQGNLLLK